MKLRQEEESLLRSAATAMDGARAAHEAEASATAAGEKARADDVAAVMADKQARLEKERRVESWLERAKAVVAAAAGTEVGFQKLLDEANQVDLPGGRNHSTLVQGAEWYCAWATCRQPSARWG